MMEMGGWDELYGGELEGRRSRCLDK
jgi:hypothetical protein